MQLRLFHSLWGHIGPLEAAMSVCRTGGYAGLEGQPPADGQARQDLRLRLEDHGLDFIAEVCTAGSYVPDRGATAVQHLESLKTQLAAATACRPLFVTAVAGCDAWSLPQSVDFFGAADGVAEEHGLTVSFETHRSRSLFNPWITRDILGQLPGLRVTCDFSHWCVVCERLLDTEPDVIRLCAERAHHVHARVGHAQGAQVPDPAAPEWREALEAHERWWDLVWDSQRGRGVTAATMTPEFGPDGYVPLLPHTQMPVADFRQSNRWIARRQQERFQSRPA